MQKRYLGIFLSFFIFVFTFLILSKLLATAAASEECAALVVVRLVIHAFSGSIKRTEVLALTNNWRTILSIFFTHKKLRSLFTLFQRKNMRMFCSPLITPHQKNNSLAQHSHMMNVSNYYNFSLFFRCLFHCCCYFFFSFNHHVKKKARLRGTKKKNNILFRFEDIFTARGKPESFFLSKAER